MVTEAGGMETASSGASPVKILELVKVLMPGRCGSFAVVWRRPCSRYAMLQSQQSKARRRCKNERLWKGMNSGRALWTQMLTTRQERVVSKDVRHAGQQFTFYHALQRGI